MREKSKQVWFELSDPRPSEQDLHAQLRQAIKRTQREQKQAHQESLVQKKEARHTTITASSSEQAERIQTALEQAGANVWKVQPVEGEQTSIQVSYHFDCQTIEGISRVLDKVQRSQGATLVQEQKHCRS